jgi:hypothetical protein
MTISQNTEYVLEHPFTKRALRSAINGNLKDLKFILDLLQIDTYQEVAALCTRAFKTNKKENYPQIEEAIREVPPPQRLNTKLPIPLPECIVVVMKSKNGGNHKRVINPRQLEIDFTKKVLLFQEALQN